MASRWRGHVPLVRWLRYRSRGEVVTGAELDSVRCRAMQELHRYSYKPEYAFYGDVGTTNCGMAISLIASVPDSRRQGQMTRFASAETIDEATLLSNPERAVSEALDRLTVRAEMHERNEWLRRDGELVSDPHG